MCINLLFVSKRNQWKDHSGLECKPGDLVPLIVWFAICSFTKNRTEWVLCNNSIWSDLAIVMHGKWMNIDGTKLIAANHSCMYNLWACTCHYLITYAWVICTAVGTPQPNPVYYLCFCSLTDSCTSTYCMYFSLSCIANPLILLKDTTPPGRG